MRSSDSPEGGVVLSLAESAPELLKLAASIGLDDSVEPAARALAQRLAGMPAGDPGHLGALLFTIADTELRALERVCKGDLARSAAASVAWLSCALRGFGATTPSPPDRAAPLFEDDDNTNEHGSSEGGQPHARAQTAEEELRAIRAELEVLLRRKLPDNFPLPPALTTPANKGPIALGAEIHRLLDVPAATRNAVGAALACDEVLSILGALLPGYGWDYSAGHLRQTLQLRIGHLTDLLERLPTLRRIADELGRMEATQRVRRRAQGGGRESVVGIRLGGEIADVLPCELALLGSPDTEDLFFQRFIERRLLCLELQGTMLESAPQEETRGPAVACVDTSGSMQGAPEAVAKALILAVARKLIPQRRPLELLLFGGPGEGQELELRPGRAGLSAILEFLRLGFHGGTDYDTPLRRAMELLRTDAYARADVLVVTDGLCRASARVVAEVAEAKRQAGARVLSVVIGSDPAGVDAFSDQVWLFNANEPIGGGFDLQAWRVFHGGA